jgi:hypothetical protein
VGDDWYVIRGREGNYSSCFCHASAPRDLKGGGGGRKRTEERHEVKNTI